MANYASLRGPVGVNRTYAHVTGRPATPVARRAAWLDALRAGRTLATNGPLLHLEVDGQGPGAEIPVAAGGKELRYRGFMRSIVPVDHVELVQDGKVVALFDTDESGMHADIEGSVHITDDGWLLLRAWNDEPSPDVFDLYPYATTNPVFVDVAGAELSCGENAEYFIAWLDRVRANAAEHPDYNTDEERAKVLANIDAARAVFATRR